MSILLQNGPAPRNGHEASDSDRFTCTIFSDVHHGDRNYNDFTCTNALKKLRTILSENRDTELVINLGDFADYLKDEKITFYEEAAAVLDEYDLHIHLPGGRSCPDGRRTVLNVIGNHEAAYLPKSALCDYVPYLDGVGCVYTYRHRDILFVSVDACFDRATGSDAPSVMITSVTFTIPAHVRQHVRAEVEAHMDAGVRGIVWLSHIAFKDIDNDSRMAMAADLCQYGLPLTMFAGHTHVELNQHLVSEEEPTRVLAEIYTLPAVTSGDRYRYCRVTFAGGRVCAIDRHYNEIIVLE